MIQFTVLLWNQQGRSLLTTAQFLILLRVCSHIKSGVSVFKAANLMDVTTKEPTELIVRKLCASNANSEKHFRFCSTKKKRERRNNRIAKTRRGKNKV